MNASRNWFRNTALTKLYDIVKEYADISDHWAVPEERRQSKLMQERGLPKELLNWNSCAEVDAQCNATVTFRKRTNIGTYVLRPGKLEIERLNLDDPSNRGRMCNITGLSGWKVDEMTADHFPNGFWGEDGRQVVRSNFASFSGYAVVSHDTGIVYPAIHGASLYSLSGAVHSNVPSYYQHKEPAFVEHFVPDTHKVGRKVSDAMQQAANYFKTMALLHDNDIDTKLDFPGTHERDKRYGLDLFKLMLLDGQTFEDALDALVARANTEKERKDMSKETHVPVDGIKPMTRDNMCRGVMQWVYDITPMSYSELARRVSGLNTVPASTRKALSRELYGVQIKHSRLFMYDPTLPGGTKNFTPQV